ncbi:MAG: hypothetical protein B6I24_01190 [Bacteroidetes bacterium 4572_128]|nr:MAG: hypothetical protein B6I24_01190 [Bacteroidetes bacterium 4572_128]
MILFLIKNFFFKNRQNFYDFIFNKNFYDFIFNKKNFFQKSSKIFMILFLIKKIFFQKSAKFL